MDNKELQEMKRIIGLRDGTDYSDENARSSLRYGRVMLMTDQDVDGSHIKGLFINLLHYLWPSLLKSDFLWEFVTPIVKASLGKKTLQFFSLSEYERWREEEMPKDGKKWKVKYYKGLGTSSSAEAKEYFSNLHLHVKAYKWESKEDDAAIELAFQKTEVLVVEF